ncbi:unnamed protein product [Closterium sp. Naga37s-1]|nr:unnamed protein product [Closterium sp. Naga37s-1]
MLLTFQSVACECASTSGPPFALFQFYRVCIHSLSHCASIASHSLPLLVQPSPPPPLLLPSPPFALLYFITLACMRPFHNGDSPTHCLSLPSPPAPSPPFLSLSLPSTTPSQELKSSAAGRLRRHAMPAAHAASTASCSHAIS